MTIQATTWAMALRDVSPVAKLAAIYISDNFDETTGRASRPLSLAKIAEFSCATVSAAYAALEELACIGVKVEPWTTNLSARACRSNRNGPVRPAAFA
jgi:hypothetical protein